MTAVPAQVAGVKELAIVAPPTPFGAYNTDMLATCHELGITEVYRLGGVLSGEHGIGWLKKGHLAAVLPPRQLELLRGIKRVFDPAGILNPGAIL